MSIEVINCSWQFKVQCPLQWESLDPTEDDRVRFCGVCLQNVYWCESDSEVERHCAEGHCVAMVNRDEDPDEHAATLGLLDYPGED